MYNQTTEVSWTGGQHFAYANGPLKTIKNCLFKQCKLVRVNLIFRALNGYLLKRNKGVNFACRIHPAASDIGKQ